MHYQALIFLGYYIIKNENWTLFLYTAKAGLLVATIVKYYIDLLQSHSAFNKTLKSTITCPNCGHKKEELVPTDADNIFMVVKTVSNF